MKICLINNLYPPYARGGAEQVVRQAVEGLQQAGQQVVLITSAPNGAWTETDGRVIIYRLRPANLFYYPAAGEHGWVVRAIWHLLDIFNFSVARQVREILQKEKPDIVHTHNLMGLSFLIPRVVRKLGRRHIHTVHDVQLAEPSGIILKAKEHSWRYRGGLSQMYQWVMRWLLGSPDVVVSPSQFLLDFYTQRRFFPQAKKVVLRNPITFPLVAESEHDFRDGPCRFLYLGQLEEHKGVMFLRQMAADLLAAGEKLELHIVGSGSQLATLQSLAKDTPAIIIHGRKEREDLPSFLQQMDVMVVPSLCYENSPTVIFESLSVGTPVLASHIEGIEELVSAPNGIMTFVAGDPQALKEKMRWCMQNRSELAEMGRAARSTVPALPASEYVH